MVKFSMILCVFFLTFLAVGQTTSEELRYSKITRIAGQDELIAADVVSSKGLNRLAVSISDDYKTDVSSGLLTGFQAVLKFGYNDTVSSTSYEDIWDGGGIYPFPTSASTVQVSSTDSDDSSTGIGARTVHIYGLDSNWDEISEEITLNGTTAVTSTNSYLRLFRMIVLTAGSTGQNQGEIQASHTGTVIAQISQDPNTSANAGQNQTLMAIYSVPRDKTFFIYSYYYTLRTGKNTTIKLMTRPEGGVFNTKSYVDVDESSTRDFYFPLPVPGPADILIRSVASTGSHSVAAGFDGVLIDNTELPEE
jgi:hypothetical protein